MTDLDPIIPGTDRIDSRDVIARIAYLEGLADDEISTEEMYELEKLQDLASQCEDYGDWQYGDVLIYDSHFEQYTIEIIDDLYGREINPDRTDWPFRHLTLNTKAAADELKQDYIAIDFNGAPYWMRA